MDLTGYRQSEPIDPRTLCFDVIVRQRFLAAVERKPRIDCCQSVAFTISASVAPLGRPINSRIFARLLSARGVLVSLARAGFAFLPALASFFGEALALPPLAANW